MPRQPTGRPRGRPRKTEPVIGPLELARIGELWLTGHSTETIAERLGVAPHTIHYHLEANLRPLWEADLTRRKSVELAKIDQIERVAWRCFRDSTEPQTRKLVKRRLAQAGVELQIVERVCSRFTARANPTWLAVVQWCIEQRCRIMGHYAPSRHAIQWDGELRVAGMNPAEVDEQMVQRLVEKVQERRQYQKLLTNMGRG